MLSHFSHVQLCDPMDCSPLGSSVHGILQVSVLEWVAMPSSRDLPNPGTEPRSSALQVDSLPAEPQGKPKNTGLGRLSVLQQISPTQELNWGLLHCRWILYQLSYQKGKSEVTQSCPTLCDPMDCIHGILQARTLEWVAVPFSWGSSQPRDRTQVSHIAGGFFTS